MGLLTAGGLAALPASAATAGALPAFAAVGGSESPSDPGAMVPVSPFRALDTRNSTSVAADSEVSFQVGGVSGIPSNISAVVLNLTVTEPQSFGFITAYASGAKRPNASNVNFATAQTVPNSVTAAVGNDGKVTLFNRSAGRTQLIADISGYYLAGTPETAGAFAPMAPTRLLDTRKTKPVRGDSAVSFQVGGVSGIPADASAVVFNLTVTEPKSFGFITAYASGSARPDASNLNFGVDQTIPNSVTVPVGKDGKVTLFSRSSGSTQLIADASGYFLAGKATSPGTFEPVNPTRMLDTRKAKAVAAESGVSFQVGGVSGIPADASAVVFNLTVTQADYYGFITAYASGAVKPQASNINYAYGQTVANSVTVPVGVDGKVTVFNHSNSSSGNVQLIADVSGYYLEGTPSGSVFTWGNNSAGQLGNGTVGQRTSIPARVQGLSGVRSVVGDRKNLALLTDGTVWAWGNNFNGVLGTGSTLYSNPTPAKVAGLSGVKGLVGVFDSNYAVLNDGTVRAWGRNNYGQLGIGNTIDSPVPVAVAGLGDVAAIASTSFTTYALLTDGTVRAWGHGGALGNGQSADSLVPVTVTGLSGVKAIAALGSSTAYALMEDGTVRSWGFNGSGQLGNGSNTRSLAPVEVSGLTGVTALATMNAAAFALHSDGTVSAWGRNYMGQLADGTAANSNVPIKVSALSGVKALTMSDSNGYAILNDGTVRAWGANSQGQLGNGSIENSLVPVVVKGLGNVAEISTATAFSGTVFARLNDGTVQAWGSSYLGDIGTGATADSNVPAAVIGLRDITSLQQGF
ncbi:hypothetical protein MB46_09805 [Arthrobacter alpinus]|nr:hypothetical protein MB46_09805 [Arthrobacter alpinus]